MFIRSKLGLNKNINLQFLSFLKTYKRLLTQGQFKNVMLETVFLNKSWCSGRKVQTIWFNSKMMKVGVSPKKAKFFFVVYLCSGTMIPKKLDLWTVRLVPVTKRGESLFAGLVLTSMCLPKFTSCQVAIFDRLVSSSKTTKKKEKISFHFLFKRLHYYCLSLSNMIFTV